MCIRDSILRETIKDVIYNKYKSKQITIQRTINKDDKKIDKMSTVYQFTIKIRLTLHKHHT